MKLQYSGTIGMLAATWRPRIDRAVETVLHLCLPIDIVYAKGEWVASKLWLCTLISLLSAIRVNVRTPTGEVRSPLAIRFRGGKGAFYDQ